MVNSPPTTHKITQIYKWYKEKCLELAPPFQRKPVWSDKNKSYLIDTILSDLPVPEIYINVKTDKDGNTKYIVVDGQQRIRSILSFIEDELEILESESQKYGSKHFSDLPDGLKKDFWNYNIVTRELLTDREEDVRAIFQRLNKNVVPLNSQELRNATFVGEFIRLMNELADDDFWAENRIVSPSDIRRMLDVEFVSELVIGMLIGIQTKDQELIDRQYKAHDEHFEEKNDIKKKFNQIKNKIEEIFPDLKSTRWHYKSDFYPLFMAFYDLIDKYHFPTDRINDIRKKMEDFSARISKEELSKEDVSNTFVREYFEALLERRPNKDVRTKKTNAIKGILIPLLTAIDSKRAFTEEERRIFWEISDKKNCAICGKKVEKKDYELDHKIPHSKGGKTELSNAQITHKKCNIKKSDKM